MIKKKEFFIVECDNADCQIWLDSIDAEYTVYKTISEAEEFLELEGWKSIGEGKHLCRECAEDECAEAEK